MQPLRKGVLLHVRSLSGRAAGADNAVLCICCRVLLRKTIICQDRLGTNRRRLERNATAFSTHRPGSLLDRPDRSHGKKTGGPHSICKNDHFAKTGSGQT